jgi:hypothetical protein
MSKTNDEWLFTWTLYHPMGYIIFPNAVAKTSLSCCTTMYQIQVLMCLMIDCTGCRVKEALSYLLHSLVILQLLVLTWQTTPPF